MAERCLVAADAALTDSSGGRLDPDQVPRPGIRGGSGGNAVAAAEPTPCGADGPEPGPRGTGV